MAGRLYNFSAGPCTLPLEILETAAAELTNYRGSGMSVMEMSHRSKVYDEIHKKALADLRELLDVPANYQILLLQGGASLQFASVPLNLLGDKTTANYLTTGTWSTKAIEEARKYCSPKEVATSKASNFTTVPPVDAWDIDPTGAYFHYCANETIHGVEFELTPEALAKIGDMPIVADMSSNFLSKPVDISKHALIYAGAQKNAGPSGLTFVIVREDFLGHALPITPTMCDYKIAADNQSMYNTPPCFNIYMSGLFFDYIKRNGGLTAFNDFALQKSGLIYDTIDQSEGFYGGPVDRAYRSRMNLPFTIRGGAEMEKKFMAQAETQGMVNLAGHRSVGGMRASVFNGMPIEGAAKLATFMREFRAANA
jgi:phosphoserine aminotransferase